MLPKSLHRPMYSIAICPSLTRSSTWDDLAVIAESKLSICHCVMIRGFVMLARESTVDAAIAYMFLQKHVYALHRKYTVTKGDLVEKRSA